MDSAQLANGLTLVLILLFAICVHEWAHAWAAHLLGDDTPAEDGRLTLNPTSHIDPVGTLVLPLFMVLMGGGMIFGWGKPVATQPSHYRIGKRWGDILVSLAGPFSNIALGTLAGIARGIMDNAGFDDHALELMRNICLINALLAGLNLLPIPPLDGFHILSRLIHMKEELYLKLTQAGFIVVLLLFMIPPFQVVVMVASGAAYLPMELAYHAIAGG